jgi:hypothetical protein
MKKTIFTIIVISIILLFTGCDGILEALYPNAKPQFEGSNNMINVQVILDQSLIDYSGYRDLPKINVKLEKDNGMGGWEKPFPDFWDFELWDMGLGYPNDAFVSFEYLPPGTYRVIVYWDTWWNGELDPWQNEFNILARDNSNSSSIVIPDPPPPEGVYIELRANLYVGDSEVVGI